MVGSLVPDGNGPRWREMQEIGAHTTIAEIAAAEKINESYVGRVLRLTLLTRRSSTRSWLGGSPRNYSGRANDAFSIALKGAETGLLLAPLGPANFH